MEEMVWNNNCRIVPLNFEISTIFNNESGWQAKLSGTALKIVQLIRDSGVISLEELKQVPAKLVDLLIGKRVILAKEEVTSYYEGVNYHIKTSLNDVWKLIILPTEKCNFACYYCYELRDKPKMTSPIAASTELLIQRFARNAPSFYLDFFGGEPLLAKSLVVRFLKAGYEASPNKNKFASTITTNGSLLTPELIDVFAAHNLSAYQITLDGPREIHDKQRVSALQKPTFDAVMNSFKLLYQSKHDHRIDLRVNVHAGIADTYLELLKEPLIQEILRDSRFNVNLFGIWGSDQYQKPVADDGETAAMNFTRVSQTFKRTVGELRGQKVSTSGLKGLCDDACYAGKPNQYVIYPNGLVGKCTVILEDDKNHIGKLGTNGELIIDENKHEFWIGRNALVDSDCQKCAYRVSCAGIGCPLNRHKPGDGTCSLRDMYDRLWGHTLEV